MKSVLISIQPKYCELIVNGKKTIEVRKTRPKIETPFKVYIYQTKKPVSVLINGTGKHISEYEKTYCYNERSGKVIGEFICDKVEKYSTSWLDGEDRLNETACLDDADIMDYMNGYTDRIFYAWHISDLKIYEKPKELSEFYAIAESGSDCCCGCVWHETPLEEMPCRTCTGERKYLYRPPQSWCYVEGLVKDYHE